MGWNVHPTHAKKTSIAQYNTLRLRLKDVSEGPALLKADLTVECLPPYFEDIVLMPRAVIDDVIRAPYFFCRSFDIIHPFFLVSILTPMSTAEF